jgi:thiamine-phosphate pyrophosphorylase
VANDRPDFALLAGCDLVHIGQDDIPIERARRLAPGIGVGVSTHTAEQLEAALAVRPAYVAFGPVFETTTKADAEPAVGFAGLRAAYAQTLAARVPLVAIGGISRERARLLVGGADAIAVISELLPPGVRESQRTLGDVLYDVESRARTLHEFFAPQPSHAGAAR